MLRPFKMTIIKYIVVIMLIFGFSGFVYAATSQKKTGKTTGGQFGSTNTLAIIDGGDHVWPAVDECTLQN